MEFDLYWLLLAAPVMFLLGWMASRLDLRQLRREDQASPQAYFKGLNLLLNEQQDKAIDAFIEAVQNDPDTAELHFALGNLFRRRGEFERAVRVHEHLIARADLKPADRDRAQHALAQDFMRAGLFDRAEAAWRKLDGTAFEGEAQLALLSLYERSRDWAHAIEVAQRLERQGAATFGPRIAHYECELAEAADAAGQPEQADAALARARAAAPTAARPLVLAGQRHAAAGRAAEALAAWDELCRVQPASFGLVALEHVRLARGCGRLDEARARIAALQAQAPSGALLRALVAMEDEPAEQARLLADHLKSTPLLSAVPPLLAIDQARWPPQALEVVRSAVDQAARPMQRYRCAACGFEARHWFWQCPGCLGWDSFPPRHVEEL